MNVVQVPISDLRHAEYNPRKITPEDFERIKKSIQEFGFVQPLVANRAPGREGVIVGGNQRFEVAKKIGMMEVPVFWVDIPDLAREKELNIRLNKNQGDFDNEILVQEFKKEELWSWGFDASELDFFKDEQKSKSNNLDTCPQCGYKQRKKRVSA